MRQGRKRRAVGQPCRGEGCIRPRGEEEKEKPDGERERKGWEETNEERRGYMEAITVGRMEGRNWARKLELDEETRKK